MKKRKKIWIPIVSVLLVAAVGGGLALYFTQRPKAALRVYDQTAFGDELLGG